MIAVNGWMSRVDDKELYVTELARFELAEGGTVIVEVDEDPSVARASRTGSVVRDAKESFEKALAEVRDAASSALGQFRAMVRQPDEVEIKFGVKLDAQVGAVIAKTGMQGHFEVKLKWRRDDVPVEEDVVEER